MNLSCDIDSDGTFIDYQERIAISDKEVICCESGVRVPPGQPYAQCHLWWAEGRAHEQADGSYERRDEDLTIYIQCIEIWRLMRSWRRCYGACLPFGAALDMINDGA